VTVYILKFTFGYSGYLNTIEFAADIPQTIRKQNQTVEHTLRQGNQHNPANSDNSVTWHSLHAMVTVVTDTSEPDTKQNHARNKKDCYK